MIELEREVEALLGERLGRECLYAPSGRLALYVALVVSLSPGDRVLMSPLTDDVVLFTLLAAGVRPVMAPLSPADGNIDPAAVPEAAWRGIRAVLTTNLYGLPDRVLELRARCEKLGIVLIEDAAHAIETEVSGQPVGSFGDMSVFSLSKHVAGVGGALAFADAASRRDLERLRDEIVTPRGFRMRAADVLRPAVGKVLERLSLRHAVVRARLALGRVERTEHRMPLRPQELRQAQASLRGLDPFDSWVRVDKHDYRHRQRVRDMSGTLERLRALASDGAARAEGVARLRELATVAPAARRGDPLPLFRVPLLVQDRDAVARVLEHEGTPTPLDYVYDPPLDDYAGSAYVDPSAAPAVARWWAAHVIPVDPLRADAALDALRTLPGQVQRDSDPLAGPREGPGQGQDGRAAPAG